MSKSIVIQLLIVTHTKPTDPDSTIVPLEIVLLTSNRSYNKVYVKCSSDLGRYYPLALVSLSVAS